MHRRVGVLALIAVVAVLIVVAVSFYSFGGDPTEYCRAHAPLPPASGVEQTLTPEEGHWTAFPIAGATCTWNISGDVHYVTSIIRWGPTLMLLGAVAVSIESSYFIAKTLFANRQ